MARRSNSKEHWRRYKKFEQENEKLRKEVSKLRKVINSMVVDQLEARAKRVENGEAPISILCEICGNGDIHEVSITRPDGEFEIRICKSCCHRHQMKKISTSKSTSSERREKQTA
jgi:hypothetical protein